MTRNLLIVCVCVMFLFGCDQPQLNSPQRTHVREQKVPEPQDIDFAKMILERKQYQFEVSRDPFEPLDYKMVSDEESEEVDAGVRPDPIKKPDDLDALLLGVVRTKNGFEALLQLDKERKIVRIGEGIKGYRVHDISFLNVELVHIEQPDHKQIIKRREDPAKKNVKKKQEENFDIYLNFRSDSEPVERGEDP